MSWLFVAVGGLAFILGVIMSVYVRGKLLHPGESAPTWWDQWFAPLKLVLRLLGGL